MSALSNRIVEHLLAAEIRENDVWLKDDYRQTRICVARAAQGEPDPFLASSYAVYGTHPDQVWPKILANRRERLGREFKDWYYQDGMQRPDVPKKKPSIYIDEQAEREPAGVLMLSPKRDTQQATTGPARTGTVLQMPSPALIAARKSLRILPA